jgi:hypothetical protein
MKTKEIYVSIVYPYQLSQYGYGKVELGELIEINNSDNCEEIRQQVIENLFLKCKETSIAIIADEIKPSKVGDIQTQEQPVRRRRRFSDD